MCNLMFQKALTKDKNKDTKPAFRKHVVHRVRIYKLYGEIFYKFNTRVAYITLLLIQEIVSILKIPRVKLTFQKLTPGTSLILPKNAVYVCPIINVHVGDPYVHARFYNACATPRMHVVTWHLDRTN